MRIFEACNRRRDAGHGKLIGWVVTLMLCPPLTGAAAQIDREDRATRFVEALIRNDLPAARRDFADPLRNALPVEDMAGLLPSLVQQMGAVQGSERARHGCVGGLHAVWMSIRLERGQLDARVAFDAADRIAGVRLIPPEQAIACTPAVMPTAAESGLPDGASELDITVGDEGWPLPGLLLMPAGDRPAAVVVLVHGSGPHDADQTVFVNKPFRDIAHGLARHGIATLRYEKRTRTHGLRFARELPDFTIDDEVVDDAVAAVNHLRGLPEVAHTPVFVLGHSLGGLLAPRIAASARPLAGAIILAGPTRPLEDIVMDQVRYLADVDKASRSGQADFARRHARVKALGRGEAVDGPLLLDLPASYWRSLQAHDPIDSARRLGMPLLILQGERDYQVTIDDYDGWKNGLRETADVEFRSYPRLNHLFMAGEGRSTPAEYLTAGTVDEEVIADMAGWIEVTAGKPQ